MGWVVGAPIILAQQQPNKTLLLANIHNGTTNHDMMDMLVKCTNQLKWYDYPYQGLKESEYGKSLNKILNICDHNALYYYGLCEEVLGPNTGEWNITRDSDVAMVYLKMHGLENQSRPSFYMDPSIKEWPSRKLLKSVYDILTHFLI